MNFKYQLYHSINNQLYFSNCNFKNTNIYKLCLRKYFMFKILDLNKL